MNGELEFNELKNMVECILFVSDKPVNMDEMTAFFKVNKSYMYEVAKQLALEYQDRGVELREIAGGLQFFTRSRYGPYLEEFFAITRKAKLSMAALETLAIVAYRQPITRIEIEDIRGVNVDGVVNNLLEKRLIKILGRADAIGKPYLYGTTQEFLHYFGLKSLEDLPELDFADMEQIQKELQRMEQELSRGQEEEAAGSEPGDGETLSDTAAMTDPME